jgi:hypothetical protein
LKRSGAQIDTIASGYRSQLFALFDHHRGYPEILLAMRWRSSSRRQSSVGIAPGSDRTGAGSLDVVVAGQRFRWKYAG